MKKNAALVDKKRGSVESENARRKEERKKEKKKIKNATKFVFLDVVCLLYGRKLLAAQAHISDLAILFDLSAGRYGLELWQKCILYYCLDLLFSYNRLR